MGEMVNRDCKEFKDHQVLRDLLGLLVLQALLLQLKSMGFKQFLDQQDLLVPWDLWDLLVLKEFKVISEYPGRIINKGPRGEPGLPGRNYEGLSDEDIERIVRHPALKVRT